MRKISTDVLPNGLRWYGQYDPGAGGFLCGIGVRTGSAQSPRGKSGLSHLAEHLVFRESSRYPLADTYFYCKKLMGGFKKMPIETNMTSMFFGSPQIRTYRDMKTSFDVITDIVQYPKFDDQAVRTEIGAVLVEHQSREADNIECQLDFALTELVFDFSANKLFTLREIPEEIEILTLTDVRRFMHRYFVPKNMFVVMLGPSIHDTASMVRDHFQDWGKSTQPFSDVHPLACAPMKTILTREIISPRTSLYHLGIAVPTNTYVNAKHDMWMLDILAEILEDRLEWRLREENHDIKKGIYHASVASELTHLYGIFSASLSCRSKDYLLHCEDVAREEMNRLRNELVSQREFDMGFHSVFENYANAFRSSPEELGAHIVMAASNGDEELHGLNAFMEDMRKANRRKLRAVAAKYLSNAFARVVIAPA